MKSYYEEFAEKYVNGELSPEKKKQIDEFLKILDTPHILNKNEEE